MITVPPCGASIVNPGPRKTAPSKTIVAFGFFAITQRLRSADAQNGAFR